MLGLCNIMAKLPSNSLCSWLPRGRKTPFEKPWFKPFDVGSVYFAAKMLAETSLAETK